nr:FecR domain-containing protein [Allomuricauda sp.]
MFEEKDDTILARWLAGELNEEEQKEFESSSEYEIYQRIAQGMQRFSKPGFDTGSLKRRVLAQTTETKNVSGRVVRLRPLYYTLAAAASIVLVIGLFFNKVTYGSNYGEQLAVILPDGSEVQLNADSELSRKRFFWGNNKEVVLKGEAFFKVEKGEGFQVKTESGVVSVLGTEFNVKTRGSFFELVCYEGKVKFESPTPVEDVILNPGDAIKIEGLELQRHKIQDVEPSWLKGRSSFSNVPLIEVIQELEAQYGISIEHRLKGNEGRFTGSFIHKDLNTALKTVFLPMGIEYEVSSDQKKVTLQMP